MVPSQGTDGGPTPLTRLGDSLGIRKTLYSERPGEFSRPKYWAKNIIKFKELPGANFNVPPKAPLICPFNTINCIKPR